MPAPRKAGRHRQLRAPGISGRPRAGARHGRASVPGLSGRGREASWRGATTGWCARKPAPMSPRSWSWAPTSSWATAKRWPAGGASAPSWPIVCEAMLGAIYLDGGWEPVKALVAQLLGATAPPKSPPSPLDAKTALQEWVQGAGGETKLPRYLKIAASRPGPCAESLSTKCVSTGLQPARGTGASRRAAEQAAATAMLIREGVWDGRDDRRTSTR